MHCLARLAPNRNGRVRWFLAGLSLAALAGRPAGPEPTAPEQWIAAGWGYALLNPASIQADHGAGLTRGLMGLVNRGQPRRPEDWGALRAWAWGAARALDYLETVPEVDARRVGIEGVSRLGKPALVTLAFEPRLALGLIGSSGAGGAKLFRRHFGEAVENLASAGEYPWFAGNFLRYAAAVAAGPVFRLLGARDLGVDADYRTVSLPPVNTGLLEGHLVWRQHDGGHEPRSNLKHFLAWASRFLDPTPPPQATLPGN